MQNVDDSVFANDVGGEEIYVDGAGNVDDVVDDDDDDADEEKVRWQQFVREKNREGPC